jgi:hypothetical protein
VLTIPQALRKIKGALTDRLPERLVRASVAECDLVSRDRILTPVVTAFLAVRQVLHGNTAASHLRHLSGLDFTRSAYSQARARLPVAFFAGLQRAALGHLHGASDRRGRWHRHRVVLIDGSSFSMPDTDELRAAFGQPSGQAEGCGFPVAHLLAVIDAHTGYLLRTLTAEHTTHDMARVPAAHPALRRGDVLVGDRGFCSYAHLALCRGRGVHALFRLHQRQIVDFRPGRPAAAHPPTADDAGRPRSRWLTRLGRHDQLVEYRKPAERPTWMAAAAYAALPATLVVRELRVRIRIPGQRVRVLTLVTTLTDRQRYSKRALAKLYRRRWQVEVDLRHLKQTLKLDVLRSQSVAGVVKELMTFAVAYNLVRRVMVEAGAKQGVAPSRVSFVDALRWLRGATPGEALPELIVNPERPNRYEPRVRKRRPKEFPLMNRPRDELRKRLRQQSLAA